MFCQSLRLHLTGVLFLFSWSLVGVGIPLLGEVGEGSPGVNGTFAIVFLGCFSGIFMLCELVPTFIFST